VPARAETIIHQTFNAQKVPLALRLSGQLLLGVVRIYARKLELLHRDSDDALVKIRQARRGVMRAAARAARGLKRRMGLRRRFAALRWTWRRRR
jgi:hypothetical protein